MQITRLELLARDLEQSRAFYAGRLGFDILEQTVERLTLAAGTTELVFYLAPEGWEGSYHIAFNVPENQFDAATEWLTHRVRRSPDESFYFAHWDAHACYFADPDGNILELIARHTLQASRRSNFAILSVSEIGLAVESVSEAVQSLGLPLYSTGSESFAALGDEEGLVIVVPVGRVWFGTTDRAATAQPVTITLADGRVISR